MKGDKSIMVFTYEQNFYFFLMLIGGGTFERNFWERDDESSEERGNRVNTDEDEKSNVLWVGTFFK